MNEKFSPPSRWGVRRKRKKEREGEREREREINPGRGKGTCMTWKLKRT
jgi:hypothetical protein